MSNVQNPIDSSSYIQEAAPMIVSVAHIYRTTGALWIMPLCLIMYDIMLTLDVEVIYFWYGRGGTLSRCLYFLNRYWPAGNLVFHNIVLNLRHPPPALCTFWFQYTGYSAGAEHLIVGAILILRLYALFDCNRKLLAALLVLYATSMGCETVLIGLITHRFHSQEALRDIFSGCAPTNIPLWCWWYWLPSLIFESTLLLLALWKTVLEARRSMTGLTSSHLMVVLLRDSVLYFGGVTLFTVANFVAWYVDPLPLYGMFVGCHIGFQSILGCRMLLNIREAAAKASGDATESLETMQFRTVLQFPPIPDPNSPRSSISTLRV